MRVEIEKIENGYLASYMPSLIGKRRTYAFPNFQELVCWLKSFFKEASEK